MCVAYASQVGRTPGRATLTYWVVGPLHSYTQEGWVDNNNKKPSLDLEMSRNYRPVSNLCFLSKIIEMVSSIFGHILDNNIVNSFQSAYRAVHNCEAALLRVYNDIVTTVGKVNGSFLVLLDLSGSFDTIDHDNLFYILEKYVGIGGSALRPIRSYLCDRTQSSN